jgi:hypothetical protein
MVLFANVITKRLAGSTPLLTIYAFTAAALTYFCVYAFRKPFTAADYAGPKLIDIEPKIMFVTVQAIGYTISKFVGIVIISVLNKHFRGLWIIFCLVVCELGLIGFGAATFDSKPVLMFINGLPLGLLWGLVFSFIEGRQTTEFLATGMCISFIIASGAVKAVGSALIQNLHVDEYWMPALTGGIFFPLLIVGTYMLELLPEPSIRDIEMRAKRVSMTHADRVKLLRTFWPGILVMTIFYMTLAAIKDFRDNFAPELWSRFGWADTPPTLFAVSEIIVGIIVVIPILLFMVFIKHNLRTLVAYHLLIFCGLIVVGAVAIVQRAKTSETVMMVGTGVGLSLAYVPFSQIIWDLILATFRYSATSGFLMYVCDSLGYLSSVGVIPE